MANSEYISVTPQIEREKNALENLKAKINSILKDNNSNAVVKNISDTFIDNKKTDNIELTITFSEPINISNSDLKLNINSAVSFYITNGDGSNKNLIYLKPTDDYSSDYSKYEMEYNTVDNVKSDKKEDSEENNSENDNIMTDQITYFYKIILEESTEKLIKSVKNDDFKESNKLLSKILKNKINNRLDLFLKK